jgi:cytochrome c biogenesis protein CcmG/thiol:disulfide interchange protein DsbE
MRMSLALVLVVAAACTGATDSGLGLAEVSSPLPAVQGQTVQGGTLSVSDYEGHVTVVNVWATWCGPCEEEQPDLVTVAKEYESQGVVFVGVNERDNLAAAKTWVERFDVPYVSVFDPSGSFADDLGFLGLPDTYITDTGGIIRFRISGLTDARELSDAIDRALALPAP